MLHSVSSWLLIATLFLSSRVVHTEALRGKWRENKKISYVRDFFCSLIAPQGFCRFTSLSFNWLIRKRGEKATLKRILWYPFYIPLCLRSVSLTSKAMLKFKLSSHIIKKNKFQRINKLFWHKMFPLQPNLPEISFPQSLTIFYFWTSSRLIHSSVRLHLSVVPISCFPRLQFSFTFSVQMSSSSCQCLAIAVCAHKSGLILHLLLHGV